MHNIEIRKEIRRSGLMYWQVAEAMKISPTTLSIWLRHELTAEKLERVKAAITTLTEGKNEI